VSGRWESVRVAEGNMRCYISGSGAGRSPAVIVAQHAGGVDDFICGMCDRFAEAGFVAAAPDLYHREEPASADDPMTRMGRLRDDQILSDMDAAVAHAKTLAEVDPERLGVTGFCMGGRVAYLMAASRPAFSAAIVFWGGNIMTAWGDGPPPFELTDRISCPVLGIFGEDDPNPNPADVARIDAEMTRFGKPHEFHSYPGAGHAFMNERRPSYRPEATADAWGRSLEWFDRYLKR
jgi:carboxymethylenebutenolidase